MSSLFRLRQALILVVALCVCFLLWRSYDTLPSPSLEALKVPNAGSMKVNVFGSGDGRNVAKNDDLFSAKCNIPKLDINGSEVIGFFHATPPLKCKKNPVNWVFIDDDGFVRFIPSRKDASCQATSIERVDDNTLKRRSVSLVEGEKMPSDFIRVQCRHGGEIWTGLLMSVARSQSRVDELKKKSQPSDWSTLDVFFLGFDSLSQMSFRRKLPKTVKVLEEVLGSIVLNGYNIVGDGTPQAFIPILTGATEVELPLTRKRYKEANYVDDVYPFLWKNFSDAGYVTAYGEDAAGIGTFTYRLKGFRNQPSDHYPRTFFQEAEPFYNVDWKCHGSIPQHQNWLRYAREFMKEYKDIPRFLLMHHSLLSHDDANLVGVMDDDLSHTLSLMHSEGLFRNALVVVMADHGHRFASLRNTHQGQLEERLPFFSLALPKTFRESERGRLAWKNLKENADKLSTPFDIHATLSDVLHWPTDFTTPQKCSSQRSLSLWRPTCEGRTCHNAGVEPHWCTCLDWKDALTSEEDRVWSEKVATSIVDAINQHTASERALCAPLTLRKLHSAKKLVPNDGVMGYKATKDADGFVPDLTGHTKAAFAHYQMKLETTPGVAVYEVTVKYHYKENRLDLDLSAISHVNKFGDHPHCIIDKNYFLATYCVCYDKI